MGLEERAHREKPHIKVYRSAGAPLEACREVELGLEEEGIPGVLSVVDVPGTGAPDAVDLAFSAAEGSPLGTGVGITADGMAVHFNRLPRERPLFYVRMDNSDPAQARHLGADAARLVKGIPFKDREDTPLLTGSPAPGPCAPEPRVLETHAMEPAAGEDPGELIARVVQRVLGELGRARGGEDGGATGSRAY